MKKITLDQSPVERDVTLSMGQYEQVVELLVTQLETAQDMIHNIDSTDRSYTYYIEEEVLLKRTIDSLQEQLGHVWYKL